MKIVRSIIVVMIGMVAYACSTVPIIGRSQLNLIPESQMVSMSLTNYQQFLSENKISSNKSDESLVKQVGLNIANAVEDFLKQYGMETRLESFDWEFNLIADETPNAWCMPGGKIVVYEGLLPLTKNADGLAVVVGHEIAHAVARHGSERMTQGLVAQLGGMALSAAIQEKPEQTQSIFLTAFGLGAQVGYVLPFSRKHEYEADKLGLIFATLAGYNPNEAIDFWTRMSQMGGQKPPEFLSTHPVDEKRIAAIKEAMPEILSYKKK